jgi:hypothetical protein
MFCLTTSPPRRLLSVITYLTPASTSKKTPSKTSSITYRSPLAPVRRSKAIRAISRIALSVNNRDAGSLGSGTALDRRGGDIRCG